MPVFLHYDQKQLDDAYDQSVYAGNRQQLLARMARNSDIARGKLGEPRRFAYGPTEVEKLDVHGLGSAAGGGKAPVCVFIHGGAWRAARARDYAWPAEMFIRAGAHYVALDFIDVERAGGDLFRMADQVRRAVAWVHGHCAQFGGDADRLYVCGTSSGGHLGGVVATTDWRRDFGLPADTVKGYTLCSGMYDLRGPRLSKRSAYVKFTDAMEAALSPQRHIERIDAPVTLLYGSHETPEFQRQCRDFAEALREAGKPVKLIHAEGYNHFELTETLGNPFGPLGRAVLEQMNLQA